MQSSSVAYVLTVWKNNNKGMITTERKLKSLHNLLASFWPSTVTCNHKFEFQEAFMPLSFVSFDVYMMFHVKA